MRPQQYPVELSQQEAEQLEDVVKRGEHTRRERERAQMLLWSAHGKTDLEIAGLLAVNPLTVARTRERWAIEKRIADAPKAGRHKKLDGNKKRFWSRWRAAMPLRDEKVGLCSCWQTNWWNCRS